MNYGTDYKGCSKLTPDVSRKPACAHNFSIIFFIYFRIPSSIGLLYGSVDAMVSSYYARSNQEYENWEKIEELVGMREFETMMVMEHKESA